MKKPSVLFIHAAWPNQFSALHAYLQESKTADSLMLICERDLQYYQAHDKHFPQGILSYTPDGDTTPGSYYYSGPAERNARHAVRILETCREILKTRTIDVIVAHALLGPPHMLFDEIDVPVISYIEYPSFRHHGWDPKYPPQDGQRYCDKYDEMLNSYAALKSARVITPSVYAMRMLPPALQEKTSVQMEAFEPRRLHVNDPQLLPFKKEPGLVYAGFFASSLSSEKGLEQFVVISKRLSALNPDVRFVLIGDPKGVGYCYEYIFLEERYGKGSPITFKDYLFSRYGVDEKRYISTGRLDGPSFSTAIHSVDFFLYPLQFGSANWGIYEILLRGKVVVASNRCFLPEIITHGKNGFLLDYDDVEGWADLGNKIARHPDDYKEIGRQAAQSGASLHMQAVAQEYLKVFAQTATASR